MKYPDKISFEDLQSIVKELQNKNTPVTFDAILLALDTEQEAYNFLKKIAKIKFNPDSVKYCKAIVYGAGMQGACDQVIADKVILQAIRMCIKSGNMIEWCLGKSMEIYNKLGKSSFRESLIMYMIV